jgi:hypothetical protein
MRLSRTVKCGFSFVPLLSHQARKLFERAALLLP